MLDGGEFPKERQLTEVLEVAASFSIHGGSGGCSLFYYSRRYSRLRLRRYSRRLLRVGKRVIDGVFTEVAKGVEDV